MRILVVDDEDLHRRATTMALRRAGLAADAAATAQQALDRLAEAPFEAVLVDLMMPQVTGLELAREIRTRFPEVAVVLTSAFPLSSRQIERLGMGRILFAPKPSSVPALIETLERAVSAVARRDVTIPPTDSAMASSLPVGRSPR